MDIVADELDELPALYQEVKDCMAWLVGCYPNWGSYPTLLKDSVILLELATSALDCGWDGALFKVNIITAIFIDDLRAHDDGAYETKQGVWLKCTAFRTAMLTRLENSANGGMALLIKDGDGRQQ